MNLRQLRTFVKIADAGGFARAEGQLHLSQPAASRQIQALESELGVPLFDRIGRRIHLTSEGEDLLTSCRRLLEDAEAVADRAHALKGGRSGTLRVGASPQHIENLLAGFLQNYRRRHPNVEVHLLEDGGAVQAERLERGDVQLALTTLKDAQLFSFRPLGPIHTLALFPPQHRLARRNSIPVTELAQEPLVLLRRGFGSRGWFDAACQIAHIKPPIGHIYGYRLEPIEDVGIVPSNVRIPTDAVRPVSLLYRGASIGQWAVIAWDPQRYFSPYADNFVTELVAYCRRNYPGREHLKRAPALPRPKD